MIMLMMLAKWINNFFHLCVGWWITATAVQEFFDNEIISSIINSTPSIALKFIGIVYAVGWLVDKISHWHHKHKTRENELKIQKLKYLEEKETLEQTEIDTDIKRKDLK